MMIFNLKKHTSYFFQGLYIGNYMFKKLSLTVLVTAALSACASTSQQTKSAVNPSQGEAVLAKTLWRGTQATLVTSKEDVTEQNAGFIGLARYDAKTNQYEFFDAKTGVTRGDEGVFFVTNDLKKRVHISTTKNYHAIVSLTELNEDAFIYTRLGKDASGKEALVAVEHKPYLDLFALPLTSKISEYSHKTGAIVAVSEQAGADVLAHTLWQGTKAFDENGKDVSEFNAGFLGLARYDAQTNRYEFFKKDGSARGDYGYYDVIQNNKVRVHVSEGAKYSAIVELTELNANKFTYRRKGKDAVGSDIWVTVEHVPYLGALPLAFTHK
jgi:hypothetical protein